MSFGNLIHIRSAEETEADEEKKTAAMNSLRTNVSHFLCFTRKPKDVGPISIRFAAYSPIRMCHADSP